MIAAATMALLVAGERWPKPEYTVHVRTFEAGIYTVNVEGEVFEFTAQPRGAEITIIPTGQRPTLLPVMDRPGGNRQIGTAAIGRDRRGRISLYPGEAVELLKPRVELSCGYTVDPTIPQRVAHPADPRTFDEIFSSLMEAMRFEARPLEGVRPHSYMSIDPGSGATTTVFRGEVIYRGEPDPGLAKLLGPGPGGFESE